MALFYRNNILSKTFNKNSWYDKLINYIPDIIKNTASGVKDKIERFFKTNKNESYSKSTRVNRAQKKSKKQSEDKIKQSKTK